MPVDVSIIGEKANLTRPEIEQIMFDAGEKMELETLDRRLYLCRRRIEKRVREASIQEFYVCSLSTRSLIYKGMFLAEQLSNFYPDLKDERFESAFAIFHQRYSTNTFPTWRLAQPFRMLAHNGEINTVKGNVNWMKNHEFKMASELFGAAGDDIKPIVQAGGSDSAALDNVFEVLVRAGRSAPLAKTILVPESWTKKASTMPELHRAMYSYANAVMEPWDGPAALCATDGRWVLAGMDRNGLRPQRFVVTEDGLLFSGSEAGMVAIDETRILRKGRVGPGQMIALDLDEGRFYEDREIKDKLANEYPYTQWTKKIVELEPIIGPGAEPRVLPREMLRRRQIAAGLTTEDLELILHPMVEDGKEAVGSMGDDTPLAVLSDRYPPAVALLPPELQPGDQSADRRAARGAGDVAQDPLPQSGQRAGAGREPGRGLRAREPGHLQRHVRADEGPSRGPLLRDRLRLPGRQGRRAAIRRPAHPQRGRGRGAPGLQPPDPDRRAHRLRPRRDPDDPGDRRGAFASGAAGPAHLHLDQRARGGVPGHALLRGADRRRRHHRQRLSGAGGRGGTASPSATPGACSARWRSAPASSAISTR